MRLRVLCFLAANCPASGWIGCCITNLVSVYLKPEGYEVFIASNGSAGLKAARAFKPDLVILDVKLPGIGIPPEHLSHIFDRFYRVDKSRSRQSGGGSGIGLTIARSLIEAHSGRIWVESAGDGMGSTFTFTVPIAK